MSKNPVTDQMIECPHCNGTFPLGKAFYVGRDAITGEYQKNAFPFGQWRQAWCCPLCGRDLDNPEDEEDHRRTGEWC